MQPIEVRANGVWLSQVGDVADVSYSFTWGVPGTPGGCEEASWSFAYPAEHVPPMLRRGMVVEVHDGSGLPPWAGLLTEPERDGDVWKCHARGFGFEANRFQALADPNPGDGVPELAPTTNVNAAIVAAIDRGLPWAPYTTNLFPLGDLGPAETVSINTLADLLDYAATQSGKRWWVGPDARLMVAEDPTTPTWVAAPEVLPPGVADESYVTTLIGRYITAMSGTPPTPSAFSVVTVEDAAAVARWGRVEQVVDYTKLGVVMDPIDVGQDLGHRLKLAGARLGYTNSLVLTTDVLTTLGGVHGAPSQVRAGQMLRLSRFLDVAGNLALGVTTDVVIQRTVYSAADDAVTVEPLGLVPRDFEGILAAPEKPEIEGPEIDG